MSDYSTINAVCRECATAAGYVPKDKVVGVWMDTCGICHERKPCTNLHHDWRRKKEGGDRYREDAKMAQQAREMMYAAKAAAKSSKL